MQHLCFNNTLKTASNWIEAKHYKLFCFFLGPELKPSQNEQDTQDTVICRATELNMAGSTESQFNSHFYWKEPLPSLSVVRFQYFKCFLIIGRVLEHCVNE